MLEVKFGDDPNPKSWNVLIKLGKQIDRNAKCDAWRNLNFREIAMFMFSKYKTNN